jgi:HPt (histidine-containing phosphotransfer) domain-containing protein
MTNGWARALDEAPDDLAAMLKQSVRADLRAASDALETGDARRIASIAHRLKGSARLIDDGRAMVWCASLERAGQAGNLQGVGRLLEEVERAFDAALFAPSR